jgi:diacylglycerol kinase family enzyme
MLALLPRTISGDYVNDPAMHQHHTTRLTIETDPETPIQVDGELRALALRSITYAALPARLDVLVP